MIYNNLICEDAVRLTVVSCPTNNLETLSLIHIPLQTCYCFLIWCFTWWYFFLVMHCLLVRGLLSTVMPSVFEVYFQRQLYMKWYHQWRYIISHYHYKVIKYSVLVLYQMVCNLEVTSPLLFLKKRWSYSHWFPIFTRYNIIGVVGCDVWKYTKIVWTGTSTKYHMEGYNQKFQVFDGYLELWI